MTRRSGEAPVEPKRATLQMPRSEAESRIKARIEEGNQLLERQIRNEAELKVAQAEQKKWSDYNEELLRRIADTDDLVRDYVPSVGVAGLGFASFVDEVEWFKGDLQFYITRLESILGRLELIPEPPELASSTSPKQSLEVSNRVFVVHGHDEEAKQSVARCIEKLDLKAIILHEQPNQGRTIIEKFEDHSDVGFAVVLLTPDDVGAKKGEEPQPRARQNVILELGFFIGRLGRQRVCALHKGDVEIPSDITGILWTPMDSAGSWHLALAREMKAAGLEVDLNRLV
jgi:predicted nucleotide-binding protein